MHFQWSKPAQIGPSDPLRVEWLKVRAEGVTQSHQRQPKEFSRAGLPKGELAQRSRRGWVWSGDTARFGCLYEMFSIDIGTTVQSHEWPSAFFIDLCGGSRKRI